MRKLMTPLLVNKIITPFKKFSHPRFHAHFLALLLLGILVAPNAWAGSTQDSRELKDYDVTGVKLGGPFTLVGKGGKEVSLSDLKGKVVVLTFGYTFCPDVCPTALLEMASARKALGKKAGDVRGIFISVDPKRDTAARVSEYVAHFDSVFVGLTGSDDQIKKVARQYGARYRVNKNEKTAASYLVDHSAYLYVLDREGKIRYIMAYNTGRDILAAAMENLVDE